jgi:predicted DNA-binding transcriptional regulator AlpA
MLRISDVIELAMVSRKTIYNAINSGRLKYQLVNVDNRQVRMFLEEDVFEAFPKTSRSTTQEQEMQALRKRWLPQVCPRGTAKGGQRHGP